MIPVDQDREHHVGTHRARDKHSIARRRIWFQCDESKHAPQAHGRWLCASYCPTAALRYEQHHKNEITHGITPAKRTLVELVLPCLGSPQRDGYLASSPVTLNTAQVLGTDKMLMVGSTLYKSKRRMLESGTLTPGRQEFPPKSHLSKTYRSPWANSGTSNLKRLTVYGTSQHDELRAIAFRSHPSLT